MLLEGLLLLRWGQASQGLLLLGSGWSAHTVGSHVMKVPWAKALGRPEGSTLRNSQSLWLGS